VSFAKLKFFGKAKANAQLAVLIRCG